MWSRATGLALVLVGLGGCDSMERAKECRRLADAVNPGLMAIEQRVLGSASQGADWWFDVADRYAVLADQLGSLGLNDQRLAEQASDLRHNLGLAGEAAQRLAKAQQVGDTAVRTRASHRLDQLSRNHQATVKRLGAYCAAR